VEARIWPRGPVCPHCGGVEKNRKMQGKSTRIGVYKCYRCRKPFSVKVGTIMEDSHIPMHLWLQAIHLMCSSKKGISSNQLHRTLGVTLKSAWFLSHRIREAMRSGALAPFGGEGSIVESDETFIGRDHTKKATGQRKGRGYAHKFKVLSLIDRTTGKARSFKVDAVDGKTIIPIVRKNIAKESVVMTAVRTR
jgi:transposase-like protein